MKLCGDNMYNKTKDDIKRVCKESKYKCKFTDGTDDFIVYGKSERGKTAKYVSETFIKKLVSLNYHITDIYYTHGELWVFFDKDGE